MLTKDKPQFNSLIESIVYNVADTQGMWQGDAALSCGVFAEVYLDARALAILEFMIPDAMKQPRFWIVRKFPTVQCLPYESQVDLLGWFDVMFKEQTELTEKLFSDKMLA